MDPVKVLLAVALVFHLSGVPAAVASPCATTADTQNDCCIRHQTESGGDVIGYCGCEGTAGGDPAVAVSLAPAPPDRTDASVVAVACPAVSDTAAPIPLRSDTDPVPVCSSPPRLSGTGFRC